MSLSLTPYIVDTQELIEVIERKKKDYSLFDPAVWRKVNQKIKDSEFSGITGKMIYEDMISKNYRFPAPVYSFGFESMMQRSMQNFRIEYNRKRRYNLLVSEGVKPDSIQYLLHQPKHDVDKIYYQFRDGHNGWTPCIREVLECLPYEVPIDLPMNYDCHIATIYSHQLENFAKTTDLSKHITDDQAKDLQLWIEVAQDRTHDLVFVIWW